MAFEGGYTTGAYAFVAIVWLYPLLVLIAFIFRRRKPSMVWLPGLPLAVVILGLLADRF
jgi:hypothetical protein